MKNEYILGNGYGKRAGLNNKFDLRKVFINPSGKCRKFP